jgi:hypothetical protein
LSVPEYLRCAIFAELRWRREVQEGSKVGLLTEGHRDHLRPQDDGHEVTKKQQQYVAMKMSCLDVN